MWEIEEERMKKAGRKQGNKGRERLDVGSSSI
jgi:hypothetical protein